MPGFGPAAEALFLREKDPKPVKPCLPIWDGTDANLRKADQLATLRQGLPIDSSVRPGGQPAGVGQEENGCLRGLLWMMREEITDKWFYRS